MDFKNYFYAMTKPERVIFAKKVGTTVGHLKNCAYGYAKYSPEVCLAIERKTHKQITRGQLRPDDGHLIWPDVKEQKPSIETQEA